jgi:HAD superfamily hydrolase (TIGR01509 family)
MDLCGAELDDVLDDALVDSVYATMLQQWTPYDDAVPVLAALRDGGVATALVSNVGVDIRPVLEAGGLLGLLDAVVLSYEVGSVKPHPEIFRAALDEVGVPEDRALMVGDTHATDGGAARVGIRTLLLPRGRGAVRGLDIVCRIAGVDWAGGRGASTTTVTP